MPVFDGQVTINVKVDAKDRTAAVAALKKTLKAKLTGDVKFESVEVLNQMHDPRAA